MMPGGKVYATEAGCFAKTFALSAGGRADDPRRGHQARGLPRERLAGRRRQGRLLRHRVHAERPRGVLVRRDRAPPTRARSTSADFLLILNRNENIIPAVAKLKGQQAAAYFMLGETQGTTAGGAEEAGKFLRVPGTNPFFPMHHDHQGNRLLELHGRAPLDVYLMNTGRVGGADEDEGSKKVKIQHSSAIVKAIAEGTIEWDRGPGLRLPGGGERPRHRRRPTRPAAAATAVRVAGPRPTSTPRSCRSSSPSGPSTCSSTRRCPKRSWTR